MAYKVRKKTRFYLHVTKKESLLMTNLAVTVNVRDDFTIIQEFAFKCRNFLKSFADF